MDRACFHRQSTVFLESHHYQLVMNLEFACCIYKNPHQLWRTTSFFITYIIIATAQLYYHCLTVLTSSLWPLWMFSKQWMLMSVISFHMEEFIDTPVSYALSCQTTFFQTTNKENVIIARERFYLYCYSTNIHFWHWKPI